MASEAGGEEGRETRRQRGREDALPPRHHAAVISDRSESGWAATGGTAGSDGPDEDPSVGVSVLSVGRIRPRALIGVCAASPEQTLLNA